MREYCDSRLQAAFDRGKSNEWARVYVVLCQMADEFRLNPSAIEVLKEVNRRIANVVEHAK